jgi:predicted ATPase/DNA-binding SARP family transcriptional activator
MISSRQADSNETAVARGSRVPMALTGFVGRQRELATVSRLLEEQRLVTLVGAAGSGKTRLAAEAVRARPEPAVWVELGALASGEVVGSEVAALLGIRQQGGPDVLSTLAAAIGSRRLLLVLDNCEHVVEACAELASRLLQECGALRILATSRQPLGVAGERAWPVPALALPSSDETDATRAVEAEAVQLFAQRAGDAVPGFAVTPGNVAAVVRICRRLDGLPLAIELAAARTSLLPPEQLVRRLDDVFSVLTGGPRTTLPRHRTLRALLDWSYELLEVRERMLLRRLAVFTGGFALEAAETVPATGAIASSDVLDLLASLVDRSLVVMREHGGEARYELLETVRQYARVRLLADDAEASGELSARHAHYYLQLAGAADEALHDAQQLTALAALDAEHDNLRAALGWSLERRDGMLALKLCRVLGAYWSLRGHHAEGRRWIEDALSLDATDCGLAAHALTLSGTFARMQGQHDVARARHAHAAVLAREAGDDRALADALENLGSELALHRDLEAATAALDEAVRLRRALAVPWALSQTLSARAGLALTCGDTDMALELRREAAEVSRRADDCAGEARALVGLGEVARLKGRWEAARRYNEDAIALFRRLGETWHMSAALHNLGWIALARGDQRASLDAFGEFFRTFISAGNRGVGAGLCLAGVAGALHAQGEAELAARALGTGQRALAAVGIKPAAADQRQWDELRDRLREELGSAAFESAWRQDLPGDPVDVAEGLLARARAVSGDAAPAPETAASAAAAPETVVTEPAAGACDDVCAPLANVRRATHGPADLCVLALGPLRVLRAGEPVTPEMWGSARPRELLLYLLTGARGRTRDEVGATFWPGATPAQVSNSFHVTLYRLRKALGRTDWIVLDGDRYRVARELNVELDAAIFERDLVFILRMLRRAEHDAAGDARGDGTPSEKRETALRLARVLELYRGDFLEDESPGDWALEERDRLRRLHADGLVALGALYADTGRGREAEDVFRRVLARDELHEPACRGLMQVLARSGQRAEAHRLFSRLRDRLAAELGAVPEPATLRLLRSLQTTDPDPLP